MAIMTQEQFESLESAGSNRKATLISKEGGFVVASPKGVFSLSVEQGGPYEKFLSSVNVPSNLYFSGPSVMILPEQTSPTPPPRQAAPSSSGSMTTQSKNRF